VQVARLAGLPVAIIRQAAAALEALEAQSRADSAQVDLFAPPAPPAVASSAPSAVEAALDALEPDRLSPREALDALYRLKNLREDPQP
jgi:DNA mismatch repair protein MutS